MNGEDKDSLLTFDIIDKVLKLEQWEKTHLEEENQQRIIQLVIDELSFDPYGPYASLRFPELFEEQGQLENCISRVKEEHIQEFIYAREDNFKNLLQFKEEFQEIGSLSYRKISEILESCERIKPKIRESSENLIKLVKLGDLNTLKNFFD